MRRTIITAVVVLAALGGLWSGAALVARPAQVAYCEGECVTVTPECIPVITATPEPTATEVWVSTIKTYHMAAGGDDGLIRGSNATYATARGTSSTTDGTGNYLLVGQTTGYVVMRSYMRWDTGDIPDDATITAVSLWLWAHGDYSTTDFTIRVVPYTWTAPLGTAREADYDGLLAAAGGYIGSYDTADGWLLDTEYEVSLSSFAFVNKAGYSYLGLISNLDIAGTQPGGNEYVRLATYEHEPDTGPYLVITYDLPAAAGLVTRRALTGVGM